MPRPSAPAAPRMRDARSLRDAFASTSGFRARGVATADVFTVAQEWLRNHNYVEYLRASALLSPSSDRMDADATPFDAGWTRSTSRWTSGTRGGDDERCGLGEV